MAASKSTRKTQSGRVIASPTQPARTPRATKAPGRASSASPPVQARRPAQARQPAQSRQPAQGRRSGQAEPPAAVGQPRGIAPNWLQWTTFVLAIGGLGVSAYLTWEHFQSTFQGCSGTGTVNCLKVTTSAQSWVTVIPGAWAIPVAICGLLFYALVMVPIMSPWAWRLHSTRVHQLRIAALIAGMGFIVYLIYAELYQIDAICLYCTSVHAITFVLFALAVFAAAMWGLTPEEDPESAA